MCSMCHLHLGLIVEGYGKLPSEVDDLMGRVSATELQQLVTKGFNIAIRQNLLLTLNDIGAEGGSNSLHFLLQQLCFS